MYKVEYGCNHCKQMEKEIKILEESVELLKLQLSNLSSDKLIEKFMDPKTRKSSLFALVNNE